jgi:hypothetical protein
LEKKKEREEQLSHSKPALSLQSKNDPKKKTHKIIYKLNNGIP